MTQNPYQRNLEIIKGFFGKPVVLVTSILLFVSNFYGFFVSSAGVSSNILKSYMSNLNINTDGPAGMFFSFNEDSFSLPTLDITAILFALAFLLFFIFSRRESPSLTAPCVLFKVGAIIELVAVCILTAGLLFVLAAIVLAAISVKNNLDAAVITGLSLLAIPLIVIVIAFLLTYTISQLRFINSVGKSLKTIYISDKGSVVYGVTSVIYAAVSAFGIFLFLPSVFTLDVPSIVLLTSLSVLKVAVYVLCAVVAFKYHSYIKRLTKDYVTEPQFVEPAPTQNAAPVVNEVPVSLPNMPSQNEVPKAPQVIICKNCGEQLSPDDYFCNNCGTPIDRTNSINN